MTLEPGFETVCRETDRFVRWIGYDLERKGIFLTDEDRRSMAANLREFLQSRYVERRYPPYRLFSVAPPDDDSFDVVRRAADRFVRWLVADLSMDGIEIPVELHDDMLNDVSLHVQIGFVQRRVRDMHLRDAISTYEDRVEGALKPYIDIFQWGATRADK